MHGTRRRLAPLLISQRGFRMPPGNVSKRVHCGDSSPGYWGLLTTGSSVPQTPAGSLVPTSVCLHILSF